MKCIIQHDDFEAVCSMRAMLKTILVWIKNLMQGKENFNVLPAHLAYEYVFTWLFLIFKLTWQCEF